MAPLSVSLILLAAVVHAVWNILAKGIRGNGTLFVWWYGLVSSVVLIPVSLLEPGAWQSWGWPLVGAAVVSGLLHTVYGTALQTGYDRAPLGVVYAVARGTGPMITMLVAVLFLGEQLSLTAAAGAVAVLVGVAVVATFGTPTSTRDDDAGLTRGSALTGVLWGAAVGACIAGYTLWDDHSMATLDLPPVLYFALTSVVLVLTLTPNAWRQRQEMAHSWAVDRNRIVAVGLLSPLAYILVLFAMQSTPVALVAPLRESSIVVGSLLAWWIYKENRLVPRLIGCAAVLTGIALISA
ncbi:drug/metabolite transporter (DMT)-like permease [Kocuria rhizophila]|uniref:DMT family transporter n=1 Tax=Kocuria TaxID=57493 RepID=UPI000EF29549|nr:DMT family transporter [Kocuria rhizophila]MDR7373350.1 drug/metabolite transporter (DMT)-like permease [Kocuria rhizophila]RLP60497.1 EamA family transporter [Kocuria rhizophila]WIW67335.1 DMT family transporter [Kocuria sp. ChxB]